MNQNKHTNLTGVEQDIKDFHSKFSVKTLNKPGFVDDDLMKFRVGFIQEEFDELKKAVKEKDMVEVADALVDIVYVAVGMADVMGIPFTEIWDEVQRSNLAKVSGKEALENNIKTLKKPRHAEDVLKPIGWVPPQINAILDSHA